MQILLKKVYDKPLKKDGCRVLVDRLWPRGVSKKTAKIHLWCREIAPSNELRRWFGHNPAKWDEFKRRYFAELDHHAEEIALLAEKAGVEPLTLLFAASDTKFNNATALKEYITKIENSGQPQKTAGPEVHAYRQLSSVNRMLRQGET
jgi:uncharacterized protein YeaO (DUF488 family)